MSPTTRAKAKTKLAKGRMKWNWNLGKARARKNWWQFRMKRKLPDKGVTASVIGGAAGLLAIFAAATAMNRNKKASSHPRSGQAPGRSHVKRSSHPAAQSRFEPVKKMFGRS